MIDPISNVLTKIRNAQAVGHKIVSFPFSKINFELVKILSAEGYLGNVKESGKGTKKEIEIGLKYKDDKNTVPKIENSIRVSRGSQRIYVAKKDLGKISQGRGIVILTTSSGLMTSRDAYKKGIGGEVICKIF